MQLLTILELTLIWNISQASVYRLLALGLPSIKEPGLGRRILKEQAEAWILAGGASKAKKKARANLLKKIANPLPLLLDKEKKLHEEASSHNLFSEAKP